MGSQIGALVKGSWGDPGKEFTDLQGGAAKVFGTKPEVAPFVPVDLGAEIGKATGFNLENLDAISGLLNQIMPGFSEILGQQQQTTSQLFENATSLLQGELPQNWLDQIQKSSAYQSLSGGYSGTPMAAAGDVRNYFKGIQEATQLGAGLAGAGANSAQMWAKLAEEAFSPFVVSTGQTAGTTAANLAGQRENLQFQYNVNAAPDPSALGLFNVNAALGQQMLSFGMGAAGGAMGGGGGGAPSAQAPAGGYGNYAPSGYAYTPTDAAIAQSPAAQNYFYSPTWVG